MHVTTYRMEIKTPLFSAKNGDQSFFNINGKEFLSVFNKMLTTKFMNACSEYSNPFIIIIFWWGMSFVHLDFMIS